jgi:hypothetical protein
MSWGIKRFFMGLVASLIMVSCGLEIPSRTDVRTSLKACSERQFVPDAVMCTALLREAQTVSGSITVLTTDGRLLQQELTRREITLENFLQSPLSTQYARAHIFKLPDLSTGQLTSLDGVLHKVVCRQSSGVCRVDDLIEGGADRIDVVFTGGKLYAMNGLLPF